MTDPTPSLATPYRTHTCGQLRADRRRHHRPARGLGPSPPGPRPADLPRPARPLRDHPGRHRQGRRPRAAHEPASRVRPEFVVQVAGAVAKRPPGTENTKLPTGAVELRRPTSTSCPRRRRRRSTSTSRTPRSTRALRLKYRYLDLRREPMQRRLMLRSRMVQAIREVHHANGFVEVETPTLIKSTPEGARDFIVPSRLQPGTVYALPQSPQQLKQLLMVAGIDRYYPDRALLPRRGPARRPPARVHPARPRDELRRRGDRDGLRRGDGHRGRRARPSRTGRSSQTPFPRLTYAEAHRALRLGQAGPALRDGAGRPRPAS